MLNSPVHVTMSAQIAVYRNKTLSVLQRGLEFTLENVVWSSIIIPPPPKKKKMEATEWNLSLTILLYIQTYNTVAEIEINMEPVFGLGWWTTLWVKCHSEQCEASKNGLMTLWHFTGLAVMSLNLSHRKTSALGFHAHLSSNSYGTRLEKTNKETPTPTPPSHCRLIYSLQNSSVVHLGESLMTRSVSALTEHDYYCAGMLTYQPTVCGVWA